MISVLKSQKYEFQVRIILDYFDLVSAPKSGPNYGFIGKLPKIMSLNTPPKYTTDKIKSL